MLSIKNVKKIYHSGKNNIIALNDISIDFPETGLVFIVGKSGAGKSTLLNILGGLDKEDSGTITIDNRSTKAFTNSDFDDLRNFKIGFIFQEFNLLDNLTVYDNIALALKMQAKSHDATAIDEVLKKVNLEGLGYRKISELSGGQKQRIAIARALIKNPSIILADEPTGALDSKTGIELISSLKALSEDKLVIAVSHDNDLAYRFASQIIELNDGKIVKRLVRKEAKQEEIYKKIGNNIIKIAGGNKLNDGKILNDLLDKNQDNLVCITPTPNTYTIAYPELYQEIFSQEDYRKQFVEVEDFDNKPALSKKKKKEKGSIKFIECLKMALKTYKKGIGRIVFLLLFTILSISLTGVAGSLLLTNNAKIVSNTLIKNDISLAMMTKNNNEDITIEDVSALNSIYSNTNFALSKKIDVEYEQAIEANSSSFAMEKFSGIIECENVNDLNLEIIYGRSSFDENSLANHEIIISDYAAYEISRTGYLGYDVDGVYKVNKPLNFEDIIDTKIKLRDICYTIIGIFDTNYENYLSLLVDTTNNPNDSSKTDSLQALKNYYYARIFAPSGFYKNMYSENTDALEQELYEVYCDSCQYYDEGSEKYYVSERIRSKDFSTFESDIPSYVKVYYGSVPSTLTGNQVIVNIDLLTSSTDFVNYTSYESDSEQFEKVKDTLKDVTISKMQVNGTSITPYSTIFKDSLEIVAIVEFDDQSAADFYFSSEYATKFNETKFNYNQVIYTLDGGLYSYSSTIKSMIKEGYTTLNIDGQTSFDNSTLESFKSLSLIVSVIFILFSFLIILNFVSSNVNSRKKEIGILRATGAKKKDIVKIFAIEEGILALIISIVSAILVVYISSIINQYFGNTSIGVELIVLDMLNVIAIFMITFILLGVATIIPVVSIASLKPIEAIRQN